MRTRKPIKLNEDTLRRIIQESVRRVLMESYMGEIGDTPEGRKTIQKILKNQGDRRYSQTRNVRRGLDDIYRDVYTNDDDSELMPSFKADSRICVYKNHNGLEIQLTSEGIEEPGHYMDWINFADKLSNYFNTEDIKEDYLDVFRTGQAKDAGRIARWCSEVLDGDTIEALRSEGFDVTDRRSWRY